MTGQLLVMALAGVLLGLCGGYPWGRWNGNRALDATWDDGYEAAYAEMNAAVPDPQTLVPAPVFDALMASLDDDEPLQVGHTIYPELAALALQDSAALQLDEGSRRDVPEPESGARELTNIGLGHPSPYTGTSTPAQRRRDKHKQRGPYAPGDLPDPPTDVGAWWQGELEALWRDGQSEWLTRNLEAVA